MMKLAKIFQKNKEQKISLVTNNSDYFLFYKESRKKPG